MALGSKAEYGSFSGAAIDVLTKSGSNEFHGSARVLLAARHRPPATSPAPERISGRPASSWARESSSRVRPRRTGRAAARWAVPIVKDRLWFFGAVDYLRSASLPPRWSLESESWGRYADAKISAAPFKNHRAWVSYHYENNDGNGWSWGSRAGVGHDDDLRLQET